MTAPKSRIIGLAGAALWLITASAAFVILSLWMIGTPVSRQALIAIASLAILYLGAGADVLRKVLRAPSGLATPTGEAQRIRRHFFWVLGVEIAAFVVLNPVCVVLGRPDVIVPLDVAIVGIHFLPLAWIFRVPRYYALGGLFCSAAALPLLLIPAHAQFGHAVAWYVVPSFGCTPVAWAIAALNLRDARRFVRECPAPV